MDDSKNAYEVPIVDLSQPIHMAQISLSDACRSHGCAWLINHGVSHEAITDILSIAEAFHAQTYVWKESVNLAVIPRFGRIETSACVRYVGGRNSSASGSGPTCRQTTTRSTYCTYYIVL